MSQVSKRAPMSEEKKKIAAEKRKATAKANKKAAYQARVEEGRRKTVDMLYLKIKSDHENAKQSLDARAAQLEADRAKEEAWVQLHEKIHANFCSTLTPTAMGTALYKAMTEQPHTGSITAVVRQTVSHVRPKEEDAKEDMDFFDNLKHVKNIKYESCAEPYMMYGWNGTHWRVTFELDL